MPGKQRNKNSGPGVTPGKRTGSRACTDHKGIEFKDQTKMCREYGVGVSTYRARINKGWTMEQALTNKPPAKHRS
jgi:hypothetical protein